jgi:hypothetical protein
VVTSGYLTKGRYIEEVIDCVRKNKNESIGIRFIFIGSGPLENLVTQAVLEGLSIIHIPHMEYNHLVDLLTIFDIGLCLISNKALSMEFSLPNRLFDYVEAGLMILSTENSDIKKHVKDFDLGEVICREKINFELIKIVRRMALRKFKKRPIELTWQAESRKIDEMYQQVI